MTFNPDLSALDLLTDRELAAMAWLIRAYLAEPWQLIEMDALDTARQTLTEIERRLIWIPPQTV